MRFESIVCASTRTKKQRIFGLLVAVVFISVVVNLWFFPWRFNLLACEDRHLKSLPEHFRLIHMISQEPWTESIPLGYGSFNSCRVRDCYITRCQGERTSDALIFLGETFSQKLYDGKPPGQQWVFMTMESPMTIAQLNPRLTKELHSKFDLSMTYRPDSNFPIPYATAVKLDKPLPMNITAILNRKRKLVAQVSSNHCVCQSRRGDYVHLMQKYIPVDVFGKCGDRPCEGNCFEMINKEYKFYLSFENSLCAEYVTEKFFGVMDMDLVAIARGNVNYSGLYPPNSYIDTRNFPSVEALTSYLQYLDKNHTAYAEYLKAKAFYRSSYRFQKIRESVMTKAFCDLCSHLQQMPPSKRHSDFHAWWSKEASCVEPKDIL